PRTAARHPRPFLDEIAGEACGDPHADRDVAVGADDVAGPRQHRHALPRSGGRHRDGRHLDQRDAAGGDPATHHAGDHGQRGPDDQPAEPAPRADRCIVALETQRAQVLAQLLGGDCHHACRSASTTRRWAARHAGARPPRKPMAAAKTTPSRTPASVGRRSTVATVNVIMLKATPASNVLTTSIASSDRTMPATRPPAASSIDSARNDARMEPRPKPSARSVPISAVRCATAAYIVLRAPKVAPIPMMTASVSTRM